MKFKLTLSTALILHICAQYIYIFLSFQFSALPKNILNYVAILVGLVGVNFMFSLLKKGVRKGYFLLTILAIVNSIFIFLEGYSFWVYVLAGCFSGLGRCFLFFEKDKPVFNPSIFAVLVVISLLPQYGTITHWGEDWKASLLIFTIGNLVSYLAGSLAVSWSYQLGFLCFSLLATYFSTDVDFKTVVPILFYPATLASISSLIFAYHVISDPITRPLQLKSMILFGVSIAFFDIILRRYEIVFADFWAYFLVQGLRGSYEPFLELKEYFQKNFRGLSKEI